ncbi:hypothetical protein [Wenxinia saemankumensis]|uniref:Uncharacterized protein n=1 Tax=Wenxinia saemankumensis TaxID=1447782 RepID=A0A1M6EYT2_9RHOB|nr:hypothetical protein [Wenxinia saemankumensis]SHI90624.1 hypothetical protein SAMN05444417_2254 [Wenxinia saemankumensis]
MLPSPSTPPLPILPGAAEPIPTYGPTRMAPRFVGDCWGRLWDTTDPRLIHARPAPTTRVLARGAVQ